MHYVFLYVVEEGKRAGKIFSAQWKQQLVRYIGNYYDVKLDNVRLRIR